MKLNTFDLILQVYVILTMSLSISIILRVVWIYERQIMKKFKELELIMIILYADLLWCLSIIVEMVLIMTDTEYHVQDIVIGNFQDFFLNISITFANLIAYCAYRTLMDPEYLFRTGNFRTLQIIGYGCPLIISLIYFTLFMMHTHDILAYKDILIVGTLDILYPSMCVCISLFYYLKIQLSFNKSTLDIDARAEINALFLFPLIILIFVLLPSLSFTEIDLDNEKQSTLSIIMSIIFVVTFPYYGIINCWAYGRSIRVLDKRNKKLNSGGFDGSIQGIMLYGGSSQSFQYEE